MTKEINLKDAVNAYKEWKNAKKLADILPDAKAEEAEAQGKLKAIIDKKIVPELDAVQARCTSRTITPLRILDELLDIEDALGIPKKAMDGVSVSVDANAQNFPSAYKFTPESTRFKAVYRGGCWRITDIRRDRTRRESQKVVVSHTEASRAALIDKYSSWG